MIIDRKPKGDGLRFRVEPEERNKCDLLRFYYCCQQLGCQYDDKLNTWWVPEEAVHEFMKLKKKLIDNVAHKDQIEMDLKET